MHVQDMTRDISCPLLTRLPGIGHGFFTRQGGVSAGLFNSLNCGYGSGDDVTIVTENRNRVAGAFALSADALCTAYQVHSPKAVVLDHPWAWRDAPEADALVTTKPGIVLGILTADCAPVLFADGLHHVIGAAHAGWKGAIGGVLEATLDTMIGQGAVKRDIVASIGPCISQSSYEVGAEFLERFASENPGNEQFFIESSKDGHYLFDLRGYVQNRLANAGISQLHVMPHDTCAQEDLFFSYRRSCLNGEPAYGRQISAIALEPYD